VADDVFAGLDLSAAVSALKAGAVVAIPTDTVYGLAVDPRRRGATDAVFALKQRPASLELPVLVADVGAADSLADADGLSVSARRLAERFWPGPLTIVVARRAALEWELGGDAHTVGLRCPDHDVARRLCSLVGPLATTSANRHGRPPLTTAAAVVREFGPEVVVVDGGTCDGMPSTVVDTTGDALRCLRVGAVPWDEVLTAI
jgi:tRNA threonylcarbamoyl adenosine modification protein (Sua5/YciO/YrdC/YwlC family)